QRAAETLRRHGHDGPLRLLAAEPEPPYDRPPLSKEFLAGELDERTLRFRDDDWYASNAIDVLPGDPAAALDATERAVVLESGRRVRFDRLLIATGSVPRRLPGTGGFDNVHELRTLADARRLREALGGGSRLVVVGAGFIGQEVAATARRLGAEVTIVEAAPAPLAGVLGADLGHWFARLHREEGIDVRLSAQIARLHGRRTVTAVELDDGDRLACDALVVGIGTVPATAWLSGSGLDDRGVPVDHAGATAVPGVYAAGDASRPFDPHLGVHVRSEHWESAARQGAAAARAMLGLATAPAPPSSFWSDQHGIRIQYLGYAHGADAIAIDGDPPARDFTATFTRHGRPIGALLVGRPHALPELRRRLTRPERTAA
ncbi:MAG TPA: FAD-dependent oxidoreductase, partial [Solirubrobacteraceae bacterium]|nr:FAD-dependent oxidoreductase [Solirubrobacteraceae bacterium]